MRLRKKDDGFGTFKLALLTALLLIAAGAVFSWLARRPAEIDKTPLVPTPSPTAIPTPLPTPTPDPTPLLDELAADLKTKRQGLNRNLELYLNRQQDGFATGSYQTDDPFQSGWWLAAVTETGWQIVAVGRENILCTDLAGYEFPVSLVPECYDQATGNLIDRATEIAVVVIPTPTVSD